MDNTTIAKLIALKADIAAGLKTDWPTSVVIYPTVQRDPSLRLHSNWLAQLVVVLAGKHVRLAWTDADQ